MRSVFSSLGCGLSIAALAGCSAAADSADPSTSDAIIGGDENTYGDSWNAIEISGCSAIALDEEWVLTARHCTTSMTAWSSTAHRANPSETRTIREIHRHASEDIALLRVEPFSHMFHHFQPWNLALDGLSGKDLWCVGRGANTIAQTGFGTWRTAAMRISNPTATGYDMLPNARGQIQYFGDSGGGCTYSNGQTEWVTGIQSTATWTCAPGTVTCDAAHVQTVKSVHQVGLSPQIGGWVDDIRQRSPLFFYDLASGVGCVSILERNGTYTSGQCLSGFDTSWTKVVALHNGSVFFYNPVTSAAATAVLGNDGTYHFAQSVSIPARSDVTLSNVTAVGADGLFFLDPDAGFGHTARVDGSGVYTEGEDISGFSTDWTHITGNKTGMLFFYSSTSGNGAWATIDGDLHYTMKDSLSGFSTTWTNVTAVNDTDLFFYDRAQGLGYTARLDYGGYHSVGAIPGFSPFDFVVGASNGALFFLDSASGVGATARVSWSGEYTYVGSPSGFSPWTAVTAK